MAYTKDSKTGKERRMRGFERTSGLVQPSIRKATEKRGFAESRLLTHWAEAVGPEIASMARPVKVSYGRKEGFGATLTLLTTGAYAPMLQAEIDKIRHRVNAVYGYNAISRIHITQTAPTGFADGRVAFETPKPAEKQPVPENIRTEAASVAADVKDEGLRAALEELVSSYMTRKNTQS